MVQVQDSPTRSHHPVWSLLKLFVLVPTGGITLIIVLILTGIWRTSDRAFSVVENFFQASDSPPEVSVSDVIVSELQGVEELTTVVFTTQSVVPTEQSRKLGYWTVGTTHLNYVAQGEVRAGVDLTDITMKNVTVKEQDDTVIVKLPPAEILDHKLDIKDSQVSSYSRGFLNLGPDVAPKLQTLAQQKALNQLIDAACNQQILDRARDRAEDSIKELLAKSGHRNVEVTSQLPSSSQCQG